MTPLRHPSTGITMRNIDPELPRRTGKDPPETSSGKRYMIFFPPGGDSCPAENLQKYSGKGSACIKLQDVQNSPSDLAVDIDRVGIKEFRLPLVVRDRDTGLQHTVATVDLGVDLPAAFKGTHMSRFVEALEAWREHAPEGPVPALDYPSMRGLLEDVRLRLDARRAYVRFRFPYFRAKAAPATGSKAPVAYDCTMTGEMTKGEHPGVHAGSGCSRDHGLPLLQSHQQGRSARTARSGEAGRAHDQI